VLLEALEEMDDLNQAERVLELALKRRVPMKSAGLQSVMKMHLRRKRFGAFKGLFSIVGEKTCSLKNSEMFEAGIRSLASFGKCLPTPFEELSPEKAQWRVRGV